MNNIKHNVGDVFTNKQGCKAVMINRKIKNKKTLFLLKFKDENEYEDWYESSNVIKGSFKNPYNPSCCGVGYVGVGSYNSKSHKNFFIKWQSMLNRCYRDNKEYANVLVCEDWHNFQNFAEWCDKFSNFEEGLELDKDLKSNECESKIYCPENCIFIPRKLNIQLRKGNS